MDYKKKIALSAAAILAVPAIINKAIFLKASMKYKPDENDKTYSWLHGDITYRVEGSGKPLLLIHGIGMGHSMKVWSKNVEELAKRYKVYTLDLLGFGASHKPKMTYTAVMYATLINDFINDIIGKPTAVIASDSSAVFTLAAYSLKADNFKKLVLIEPRGIDDKLPQNSDKTMQAFFELPILGTSLYNIEASKLNQKEYLLNNAMFAKEAFDPTLLEDIYTSAHLGDASAKYAMASYKSNFMNICILNLYKDVQIPMFVIWGENSTINPVENMETLTELRPDVEYIIFEETRLLPQFENFTEFNKLIPELLK